MDTSFRQIDLSLQRFAFVCLVCATLEGYGLPHHHQIRHIVMGKPL